MKYFTEILTKISHEDNYTDPHYHHWLIKIKTRTERKNLQDARTALNQIKLQENELKRIHKCYHDEHPPKSCVIEKG